MSSDQELDRTLDAVGPRLKQLRVRREITLAGLAQTTGISASTLSRLEAGLRRPTLEQLLPLAKAYGVSLDDLVNAPQTGDPRINLRPISGDHGSVIVPLSRRPGGIQAYKFIRPGATDADPSYTNSHEGYEWVYVLNGALRMILGDVDLVLNAGEAAEFDTRTPHWFGSASNQSVEYLCLFSKQGERAHVRVGPDLRPDGPAAGLVD